VKDTPPREMELDAKLAETQRPREQPPVKHDENCDALQPGPQLGPPTKPCNCRVRVDGLREQAPVLAEAECRLHLLATGNVNRFDEDEAKTIANELDRLRSLVRSLGGET
jgi:hypothetical protein